ncbi:MAG: phosphotransferase family protein [Myxococcota bacterium]
MSRDVAPRSDASAVFDHRLAAWLAGRLGSCVAIEDLRRPSVGFSWETFTFLARWPDPTGVREQGLVVRRQPADGVLAPYDVQHQYHVHAAIAGVVEAPIPPVWWLEMDPNILGAPFYVMERAEGVVPEPDDDEPFAPAVRASIGEQFVDALADIHGVAPGLIAPLVAEGPSSPGDAPLAAVERWERFYRDARLHDIPAMRLALGWLRRHQASSGRLALCHGDYRLGNFVVDDDRITAILDWELAHIGDPYEDLTWAAMRAFQGRSRLVGQLLSKEDFYELYAKRTGLRRDPDVERFWTILNHVKAVAIYLRGCQAFEQGRTDDVRLAAMGHRCRYLLQELMTHVGAGER